MKPHLQRIKALAPAAVMVGAAALLAVPQPALAQIPFNPNIVADVAEKVTPAVVNITTRRNRGQPMPRDFREFFGRGRGRGGNMPPQMGAGSGVIVSADGDIVTNNHVIEGADDIRVTFADRREFTARLVGADRSSDLAFLKIDATNLPHLPFGNSQSLRLGEFVLAIGNPFGVGQTVTMGIVSAKGRANMGIVDYEDFIQTDASINPGNSGGALVNLRGELVGINTAILSRSGGAQGIGFAVPTSMVQPIRAQIVKHGRVRRGWLGVSIQDLTPDLARNLGMDKIDGVVISDVLQNGPAAKAGLIAGDVVVAVNDLPTRSSAQLRNRVALIPPGSRAKLSVIRSGSRKTITATLGEKEQQDQVSQSKPSEGEPLGGVQLGSLDRATRRRLRVPAGVNGVVVTSVQPGSTAERSNLEVDDVIVEVNKKAVKSVRGVKRIIRGRAEGTSILLRIFKRGGYRFVVLG